MAGQFKQVKLNGLFLSWNGFVENIYVDNLSKFNRQFLFYFPRIFLT
jgi:hypothetical protein